MKAGFLKATLLAAMMAVTGVAQAADFTIRATANSNENDEDYDGLVVFKNYVESASNGAIAVELFIGTQLCSKGAECLQGVADGSIDVYISTSGGAAGIFPYVQVLDLPYLMADDRVAEHVLSGDFTRTMREMALEDSGGKIRLMTIGNTGGWRNFANTKRRVQNPGDMAGLKIRTVVADLPQELVRALGAPLLVCTIPSLAGATAARALCGASVVPALVVAASHVALGLAGAGTFCALTPRPLLAALVISLGLTWLVGEVAKAARQYTRPELGVVLVHVLATATLGMAAAVALGLLVTVSMFVVEASRHSGVLQHLV